MHLKFGYFVLDTTSSSPIEGPRCFREQETLPIVLVDSSNGFERDITLEIK